VVGQVLDGGHSVEAFQYPSSDRDDVVSADCSRVPRAYQLLYNSVGEGSGVLWGGLAVPTGLVDAYVQFVPREGL